MTNDNYGYLKDKLKDIIDYWENEEDGVKDSDVQEFLPILAEYIEENNAFKLYKYNSPEYYSFRNYEKDEVYLSPNGNLNDVYEGLPAFNKGENSTEIEALSTTALMSCFSETNKSVLMWAHYADSSKGFCVEYDLKRLSRDEIISLGIYPVLYDERRLIRRDLKSLKYSLKNLEHAINYDEEYDDGEVLDDLIPLMLYKGNDWQYEKEWRIISTKLKLYQEYKTNTSGTSIPLKCVSAIYLGYRMELTKKKHIIEITQRKNQLGANIIVYEAILSCDAYEFDFVKVDIDKFL